MLVESNVYAITTQAKLLHTQSTRKIGMHDSRSLIDDINTFVEECEECREQALVCDSSIINRLVDSGKLLLKYEELSNGIEHIGFYKTALKVVRVYSVEMELSTCAFVTVNAIPSRMEYNSRTGEFDLIQNSIQFVKANYIV